MWAVGATVDGDGRAKFDAFLRQLLKRETPDDLKAFEGKGAQELKLPPDNKKVRVARHALTPPPRHAAAAALTTPPPPLSLPQIVRTARHAARAALSHRASPPLTPFPTPSQARGPPRRVWCSTTATSRPAPRGRSG